MLNDFAGNPGKAVFDQLFPSLHRKTLQNWLGGRNKLTRNSKGMMAQDFAQSSEVPDTNTGSVMEEAWDLVDCPPGDHVAQTPWHSILTTCEHGLQKINTDRSSAQKPLLQSASMEELQLIEQEFHEFEGAVFAHDFDRARVLLNDELDNHLLFNRLLKDRNWLDEIENIEDLMPYFSGIQFNSFLYLLALLDYSLARRNSTSEAQSIFDQYLPVRDGGKWLLPLRVWIDELLALTGFQEIRPLAKKILGETGDWENLAYKMYRWQGTKITPPWEEIAAKLNTLQKLGLLSRDEAFLLLMKFGIARTIQAFHFSNAEKLSDEVLEHLYAGYDHFYKHHSVLNVDNQDK